MISDFVFAFLATVSFGILFQGKKDTLWQGGIIGAVGWIVFTTLKRDFATGSFEANFIATVMVALLGELSARIFKKPATVFINPAVIPLVPGLGMYQGMHNILLGAKSYGSDVLLGAAMDSCAIALGIMMVSGAFRIVKAGEELAHLRSLDRYGIDGSSDLYVRSDDAPDENDDK